MDDPATLNWKRITKVLPKSKSLPMIGNRPTEEIKNWLSILTDG